ncbi:hypothetical protein B0H14DRAFT_2575451 [Mycena olivaceomarginata]|nr:hypothetical protein B0H14DRAFT_2575451 [Mycena olivaceomarginata]
MDRGLGLVYLTTFPEVNEVKDVVDIGVGGGAVLLLKMTVLAADRLNTELSWTRGGGGGGQVGGGGHNINWIRNLSCWRGAPVEIGSRTGGTDAIAVLKYKCEEVDMDMETDVEGPGAEEGNGWLNFLCFTGVLVELQRLSVVADVLEPILSTVDWTLM